MFFKLPKLIKVLFLINLASFSFMPNINNAEEILTTKSSQISSEYINSRKELEDYIVKDNKDLKKKKKGSKEYLNEIELEKSKMSIQRFKGLGEMNPEELWSTTLDPETRSLLQVKYSKDFKKDQDLIHTLMGNDVALRKDFIISNAINVQNLDI